LKAPGVNIVGSVNLPFNNGNEQDLQQALAIHGPVTVALAVTAGWQFYSGGTLIDPYCANSSSNHMVAFVGYGADSNGIQNYILRNSWSSNWGIHLIFLFFYMNLKFHFKI
jgi:C1A family cysteine protease